MASRSVRSGPSSESEQVCVSPGTRGRCSGCRLICVLRRFLTAFREVLVLAGSAGSASRSEIRPWASPITAMSTTTLVPDDCRAGEEIERFLRSVKMNLEGVLSPVSMAAVVQRLKRKARGNISKCSSKNYKNNPWTRLCASVQPSSIPSIDRSAQRLVAAKGRV